MNTQDLVEAVNDLSKDAGAAILEVYHQEGDIGVVSKSDGSPLTEADLAAHKIIEHGLQKLTPELPVLSEESESISWEKRRQWKTYWLVDPLDGTKEFINRNGEFTVNIALIDNGEPILGVVYVPVFDILYYGTANEGAFKEKNRECQAIHVSAIDSQKSNLRIVVSRSHRGKQLEQWIANAQEKFANVQLRSMGSSLKICLVAEGQADIYPRLALTSEWDTGAAQAILEAAGGVLTDTEHNLYRYNQKEDILNPFFFALGEKSLWDYL